RPGDEPRSEVPVRRVQLVRRRRRRPHPAVRPRGLRLGGVPRPCPGGGDPRDPHRPRHRAGRHRPLRHTAGAGQRRRLHRGGGVGEVHLPDGAKYFVLEGPAGVSVVNERNEGWNQTMEGESAFTNLGSQTANWSTQEAKSVFETVLKSNGNDVQLVFAQNDEMGLGAAQAVQEAGLTPGEDVKIATIDGTQAALEALADGTLSFVAEYNPLF